MNKIIRFLTVISLLSVFSLTANDAVSSSATSSDKEKAAPAPPPKAEELFLDDEAYKSMLDFLAALAIVKSNYVDTDKTSYEKLFKAALRGMMHELDPFSNFESSESMDSMRKDLDGNFAGIGVVISTRNRILEIVSVMPGGPSEKAGIKAGDIITEIDGNPVNGLALDDSIKTIKGKPGSVMKLKIYRGSDDSTRVFNVTREIITVSTITGMRMTDPENKVGYFRITQFGSKTAADLDKAIDALNKEGMKALVIDLRDNPGGLLDAAIAVCSRFVKTGTEIVSIEGRDDKKIMHRALPSKKFLDLPLVILINGNSASSSEIFSACMQDHKRAIIVGEKSFGKGSVQTVIPFGNNEALRITTAKYFTPGRRVIHGNGIEPDIGVPLSNAHRFLLSQQLNNTPGVIKPPSPTSVRDIQLERALEILKGISLYRELDKTKK